MGCASPFAAHALSFSLARHDDVIAVLNCSGKAGAGGFQTCKCATLVPRTRSNASTLQWWFSRAAYAAQEAVTKVIISVFVLHGRRRGLLCMPGKPRLA